MTNEFETSIHFGESGEYWCRVGYLVTQDSKGAMENGIQLDPDESGQTEILSISLLCRYEHRNDKTRQFPDGGEPLSAILWSNELIRSLVGEAIEHQAEQKEKLDLDGALHRAPNTNRYMVEHKW